MSWEPIRREGIKVKGVNQTHPGLLDVEIQLKPDPPPEWVSFFRNPTGVSFSLSMHPPKIDRYLQTVHITPPDGELDKYVKYVDEVVEAANRYYQVEVIPRLEREDEQRRQQELEREERIQRMKQEAAKLESS